MGSRRDLLSSGVVEGTCVLCGIIEAAPTSRLPQNGVELFAFSLTSLTRSLRVLDPC
jgi:hypothetical protein